MLAKCSLGNFYPNYYKLGKVAQNQHETEENIEEYIITNQI